MDSQPEADIRSHRQQIHEQQQAGQPEGSGQSSTTKKRKKEKKGEDSPSVPRRLRRSHEACTRCRGKKIKCDSKHPKCGACASAGAECHQEDRHRQLLTPRGHTEHLELRIKQCDALLKRHLPGFAMENIEDVLTTEGIEVDANSPAIPMGQPAQYPIPTPIFQPMNTYPIPPPPPPGFPYAAGMYPHAAFTPHGHQAYHPPLPPASVAAPVRGQDPQSLDVTNTVAIAKSFGFQVPTAILNEIRLADSSPANLPDKEDIAVGSGGLSSGRGRTEPDAEAQAKRNDPNKWLPVVIRRSSQTFTGPGLSAAHIDLHSAARTQELAVQSQTIWLPKDRKMLRHIVEVYFSRLNIHRPVYTRPDFERDLDRLYNESGQHGSHDPGFLCGLYLVLALGTLNDLNQRAGQMDAAAAARGYANSSAPLDTARLMPEDWPHYTEFFNCALAIQPDLRVTLSALQALILLHWYLYTERQGRTLWRLVGSLVRMAIELGLHHDPTTQTDRDDTDVPQHTFTAEECRLRIRLWGIIIIHDRGTSVLLGRPLSISPFDTNTPHPPMPTSAPSAFSEHFLLSHAVAEIQADIVNSLYTPQRLSPHDIMHHTRRIIESMVAFRNALPDVYARYFSGTDEWPIERRRALVHEITEDQGLTLLKLGIARILLLRAVISSAQLSDDQRIRALNDAVITSHNVIVVHNQLIRFPDIAFFTSPIPLHISAMVMLYGQMMPTTSSSTISKQMASEDVWLALDMIPKFRWRWDRKDVRGEHPLIAHFASQILQVDLHQVRPSGEPVLISEQEWTAEDPRISPTIKSQHSTPTLGQTPESVPQAIPPVNGQAAPHMNIMDVAVQHLYPFYPENASYPSAYRAESAPNLPVNGQAVQQQQYQQLFANTGALQASYGCQPSESTYVNEVMQQEPRIWAGQQPNASNMVPGHYPVYQYAATVQM